jgi:hypothetical protein
MLYDTEVNWRSCTADNTTDTITDVAHGLANDDWVEFNADTMPTGLSSYTIYWVVNAGTDTFQVSATQGGGAIDFTTDGTDVVYRKRYK